MSDPRPSDVSDRELLDWHKIHLWTGLTFGIVANGNAMMGDERATQHNEGGEYMHLLQASRLRGRLLGRLSRREMFCVKCGLTPIDEDGLCMECGRLTEGVGSLRAEVARLNDELNEAWGECHDQHKKARKGRGMSERCTECGEVPAVPETFRKPVHEERDDLSAEVARLRRELKGAHALAAVMARNSLADVTRERDEARGMVGEFLHKRRTYCSDWWVRDNCVRESPCLAHRAHALLEWRHVTSPAITREELAAAEAQEVSPGFKIQWFDRRHQSWDGTDAYLCVSLDHAMQRISDPNELFGDAILRVINNKGVVVWTHDAPEGDDG